MRGFGLACALLHTTVCFTEGLNYIYLTTDAGDCYCILVLLDLALHSTWWTMTSLYLELNMMWG